ncbi:chaperone protein DnaJ [Nitzschia inconspicua]|uniref:Chaperone protein DnaJ n=1 Tax=Nitzschia inconspicua TaxID=303405 RepID=A0A9K3KV46_9STRA|nr:chaperone protein DnaJ [Nitzschia inconspicua]KAG7349914.1 chaperone protein DnaJ [Nitzschia inconspicua]
MKLRNNRFISFLTGATALLIGGGEISSSSKPSFTGSSLFAAARKVPELTSTALRLHKIYNQQPPHDRQLYDILQVLPNATQAQITESYRSLSREYHPDKRKRQSQHGANKSSNCNDNDAEQLQLQQLQQAYQILKVDSTRIFYHKFGLTDPNLAVLLLLGPKLHPNVWRQQLGQSQMAHLQDSSSSSSSSSSLNFETLDLDLMRLIGYDEDILRHDDTDESPTLLEERRIHNIAALLVEQMRPIVEGTIDDVAVYGHMIAQQCDRWKRLPLGAQIIRCVGRAYRHVGQDFLQQNERRLSGNKGRYIQHVTTDATVGLRKRWHSAKHMLEAGAFGVKLMVTEHFWNNKTPRQQPSKQQNHAEAIEYHNKDDEEEDSFLPFGMNDEHLQSLEEIEERRKRQQEDAAQTTILQALQVEALWKACKIDIDRVVRRACQMILSGDYFFFPSYTAVADPAFVVNRRTGGQGNLLDHGWVATPSGNTIDAEQARLTAAQTMVMFGDILVKQSKQGTSWKD